MTLSYYSPGRTARGAGRAGTPSSGGNALSHRPDCPPGTTLYTPAFMCVPPALHTNLTERDPTAPLPHRSPPSPIADGAATTYAAAHRPPEGIDYTADTRVRRPASMTARSAAPPSPEAPGFGTSIYRAELLQRSSADLCAGSSAVASTSRSASAPTSTAARFTPAAVRPGYLTTSAAASLPVAERYIAAAPQAAPRSSAASDNCSGACGVRDSRPASSSPGRQGGGAAVFTGSQVAACFRDPPAAWAQPAVGLAGTGGPGERPSKDAAYLRALDQHSRGRLPGYTGHRPQQNVSLDLPPPSSLTTWGAASQEALRRPLPPTDTGAHGTKSACLAFFSAGSSAAAQGFVSENGLAEAARFHETTRPLEGRMNVPRPSTVAPRGARFAN